MLGIPLLLKSIGINTVSGSLIQLVSRGFSSEGHFAFQSSYLLIDENRKASFSYEDDFGCASLNRVMHSFGCRELFDRRNLRSNDFAVLSLLLQNVVSGNIEFLLKSSIHRYSNDVSLNFICCFYPCLVELLVEEINRKVKGQMRNLLNVEMEKTHLRRLAYIQGDFETVENLLSEAFYVIRKSIWRRPKHTVLISNPFCKPVVSGNSSKSNIISRIIENNRKLYQLNSLENIFSSFISTCMQHGRQDIFFVFYSSHWRRVHECLYNPLLTNYPIEKYAKLHARHALDLLV